MIKNFRELLRQVLSDEAISAILVGERHYTSLTCAALLANLDLLIACDRKIIFAMEALSQEHNHLLSRATPLNENEILLKLKKTYDDEYLLRVLLANRFAICGLENEESNPSNRLLDENKYGELKFFCENQRISVANQLFSNHINGLISSDNLIIFIGGAAHPIEFLTPTKDLGMKNRIAGSISIHLKEHINSSIEKTLTETQAVYFDADTHLPQGKYDFSFQTNDQVVFSESFNECKNVAEIKKMLLFHLKNLVKLNMNSESGRKWLKPYYKNLITACEKSLHDKGMDLEFINLKNCVNEFRKKIKNGSHGYSILSFFNKYLLREKGVVDNFSSAINKDFSKIEESLLNKNGQTDRRHLKLACPG
jgi:hypothetical protein